MFQDHLKKQLFKFLCDSIEETNKEFISIKLKYFNEKSQV